MSTRDHDAVPGESDTPPVTEEELAYSIKILLACMTHMLPLRGKHGTPRDQLDAARDRLARALAERLLLSHEVRKRPPAERPTTGRFMR